MAEWVYRATVKKAMLDDTLDLLDGGFLCRTAHDQSGRPIANVSKVQGGDIVHVYYRIAEDYEFLGSYRVLEAEAEYPCAFTEALAPAAALVMVPHGSELATQLTGLYQHDPKIGHFTGWCVEERASQERPGIANALRKLGNNAVFALDPATNEIVTVTRRVSVGTATLNTSSPTVAGAGSVEPVQSREHPGEGVEGTSVNRVVGVDWSGSAHAGKKIWVATIDTGTSGLTLRPLETPFDGQGGLAGPSRNAVAQEFANWFRTLSADVVGFDFCFGIAHEQQARLSPALSPRRPAHPIHMGRHVAQYWGDNFTAFRAACHPEAKRATDQHRRAPFAPTNLRMFRQTALGLVCLGSLSDVSIPPWDVPRKGWPTVVEILPAGVASVLGLVSYKSKSAQAVAARVSAIQSLGRGGYAVGGYVLPPLAIATNDQAKISADKEGDALDAVFAAIAALAAARSGFPAPPPSAAQVLDEGWIY